MCDVCVGVGESVLWGGCPQRQRSVGSLGPTMVVGETPPTTTTTTYVTHLPTHASHAVQRLIDQLMASRAREGRGGHNRLCGLIEVPGTTFLVTVQPRPTSAQGLPTPALILLSVPAMPA